MFKVSSPVPVHRRHKININSLLVAQTWIRSRRKEVKVGECYMIDALIPLTHPVCHAYRDGPRQTPKDENG